MQTLRSPLFVCGLALSALAIACSSDSDDGGTAGASGGNGRAGSSGANGSEIPGGIVPMGIGDASAGQLDSDASVSDPSVACVTVHAGAELLPVHLAFAFDVSGSMGKGDELWHDRSLKWDPVVAATRAFFDDTASDGLLASLTFFPADGDEDERCDATVYEAPDVEMTELPSQAFSDAIADIDPQSADDWRGGTPTLFAVQGVESSIRAYREDHQGHFAIVLVTDGYPQGCDDAADSVDAVAEEVTAARADGIDTYVIGVANPPVDGAPDTVSDLHAIAEAGGTEQAFLIDTGDPSATSDAFDSAVSAIAGRAIACSLEIPRAPDNRELDKQKVAVTYASGSAAPITLTYDADCAGEMTWHYDNPADPRAIELCDDACTTIQADPDAELGIDFACEQLLTVD